ncbi:citrate (pro-3S)-lyase subunit beta [Glaciibacter psychrotolerans]
MRGGGAVNGFDLGPALLFCPADRPDRYAQALDRADAVIIDLEDAVGAESRPAARAALIATPVDPDRTIVRVNAVGTSDCARDLAALAETDYRLVMVPKVESATALDVLDGFDVVALCESAAGILAAADIAASSVVVALMWGAEDLVASLGGTGSRFADGRYRDVARHARAHVLLAAGAQGKAAIDTVHLNISDLVGLAAESEDAVASGFRATACIHPSQVETIRSSYRPSPEQIERARELLRKARDHDGVFVDEGRMIDGPVLRHAEAVLRRTR